MTKLAWSYMAFETTLYIISMALGLYEGAVFVASITAIWFVWFRYTERKHSNHMADLQQRHEKLMVVIRGY